MSKKLLILGGTREAIDYAHALSRLIAPKKLIYSLAGVTNKPQWPKATQRRLGGFGGTEAMGQYLRDQHIAMCLDATHPFAHQISAQAAAACAQSGIVYQRIQRCAWQPQENDHWRYFADSTTLIKALDSTHPCALFTLGQRQLDVFAALQSTCGIFRMIHPPQDTSWLDTTCHQILCLRPPYLFDKEIQIIDTYAISCLVTRNSGGQRPDKLDAYASRRLPVWFLDDQAADHTNTPTLSAAHIAQQFQQFCLE